MFVQLGVQRASELVGGEDVEAVVTHKGGRAGDRVEGPVDFGPDALFGVASARPRRRRVCGTGEVAEVGPFGVVELKRAGERAQDALGDAVEVAALQSGVVRDAHAGQDGDLFAAQPGDASRAVAGETRLGRGDPRAAGGQELADLAPWCPQPQGRAAAGRGGRPCQYPYQQGLSPPGIPCFLGPTQHPR